MVKLNINKIDGKYNGSECFVHARMCADGDLRVMTMQKLYVRGSDLFSPLFVSVSHDGGDSWSEPVPDEAFILNSDDGMEIVACDASLLTHKKSGKMIITGAVACYGENDTHPIENAQNKTFYSVFDRGTEKFAPIRFIDIPPEYGFRCCNPCCSQFIEDDSGDLLIPVNVCKGRDTYFVTIVMKCSFNGSEIKFKEFGNELEFKSARGLYEPSICKFKEKYYLTLRNDDYAFYAVSNDGLHFSEPEMWKWDTDEILPSYNTQQHWLICAGKLHLVYTRRAGNNDHVFRHRAPLFIAEVDVEKMRILRHTEQIAAPERGARLGNFGVSYINENHSVITAAEWMQPAGCEKYGSDNSIYVTEVTAEEK